MIIPSISGTAGIGFAEVVQRVDGSPVRRGMIKLAPAVAPRIQTLVDDGITLIYSGPVWDKGRWRSDSFPVIPTAAVSMTLTVLTLEFVECRVGTKRSASAEAMLQHA